MRFMTKIGITVGLGCVALAANAVDVTFEAPLPLSPPIPVNPIVVSLADSLNDLSFATRTLGGLLFTTGTVSSIVDLASIPNTLDSTSKQALQLAPVAGQLAGPTSVQNVPYTEMSFVASGQALNGVFSFQYSSNVGISVQFFQDFDPTDNQAPIQIDSILFPTTTAVGGWSTFSHNFDAQLVTSVRFGVLNNPSSPDLPKDSSYIDNMSINYSHSAMVPEPSTYALMVLGLFGIGFVARRRMS